jgi:hypothetical protein
MRRERQALTPQTCGPVRDQPELVRDANWSANVCPERKWEKCQSAAAPRLAEGQLAVVHRTFWCYTLATSAIPWPEEAHQMIRNRLIDCAVKIIAGQSTKSRWSLKSHLTECIGGRIPPSSPFHPTFVSSILCAAGRIVNLSGPLRRQPMMSTSYLRLWSLV